MSTMMSSTDTAEKMVPSAEEKEEEKQQVEEEEEPRDEEEDKGTCDKQEEGGDDDDEEEGGEEDEEEETEPTPQATDKVEGKQPLPDQAKEKKEEQVLNLNNEVVKMRKEVKRVRALIIRKLTRQIAALKKKKGKEAEVERNQRRATRLLEEIHAMKALVPDKVTKTALQKCLNFEQVCKNPKSTISDRAVARIATHPQYNKKVEAIKAAVNAFKEERMKDGKQGGNKAKVQNQAEKVTPQLTDTGEGREDVKDEKEEGYLSAEGTEMIDNVEGEGLLKDTGKATVADLSDTNRSTPTPADIAVFPNKEVREAESVRRPTSTKSSEGKDSLKNKPQSKAAEKKVKIKPVPKVNHQDDGEESDLESSDDEEKEYFDDSTEERFHKQSSQSEDSDEDDFFVGKVSAFKKKKKKSVEGEKKNVGKSDSSDLPKMSDQGQSELDELESRLKSKANKFQSVFCTSLSGSKASGGEGAGRGRGRGRGGNQSRGQGNQKDGRNFGRASKLQEQHKGQDRNFGADYGKLHSEGRHPESQEKGPAFAGRGRGRGRGRDVLRQKDSQRGGAFPHQVQQPALHPSWEASKKRKEQQGQILAFQGKKIKFDDDD